MYQITCTCGDVISVDAQTDEEAVSKLIPLMDAHVEAMDHPDVPKTLTQEQKVGMVKSQMKRV